MTKSCGHRSSGALRTWGAPSCRRRSSDALRTGGATFGGAARAAVITHGPGGLRTWGAPSGVPVLMVVAACVLTLSAQVQAQGSANFSGTWKLTKTDPPVPAGRGGGGRGGGISGPYADTTFNQAPETIAITQSGSDVTVQIGSAKAVFTLDGKTMSTPPGDVLALKTRAHWDGAALHLHYKQGMNWGRDILRVSGGTLTLVRDLESGGASTTRTLTYSKTS